MAWLAKLHWLRMQFVRGRTQPTEACGAIAPPMSSVKGLVETYPRAAGLPPPRLLPKPVMSSLRTLIVVLMVTLAGCATREPPPSKPSPPVVISESTWRRVDSDIFAASQDATEGASDYANDLMKRWRNLVYQRTEAEFIPWFSSYWTRQWLTMKVTWYQMNAEGKNNQAVDRLALYLQEQYQDQVLDPVAKQISPNWVMAQSTQLYVRLLRKQLEAIPPRYGVPLDQFDRRLQGIPAITLDPPSAQNASLSQLFHAEPIDTQPAFVALVTRIHNTPGRAGAWPPEKGISSVARMTSKSLINERTTSGVASVVSAIVGRVAGLVISLGTAGFTAMLRENERPKMEAQLRNNLQTAFDKEWVNLMRNPQTGILAGVNHLSGQVEGSLAERMAQPVRYEPPSPTAHLPEQQPLPHGNGADEGAERLW